MAKQDGIEIQTTGRGLYDITTNVINVINSGNGKAMLCNLFCQHTSASLIICENYDDDVKIDIDMFLSRLVQDGAPQFTHTLEGKDDMAAHIRTVLTQSAITLPVINGKLGLGQWQGICLYEHRLQHHRRKVIVTLI